VKEAVQMIEQEENVQKALEILQEAPLEEAYQAALDQKNKAEAEILQVMEAFRLKASLLVNEQKHEDAIACYLKMIDISLTNKLDVLELANIYYNLGASYNAAKKPDQSLEANLNALKIREENLHPDHPWVIRSILAISLNYSLRQDLPAARAILMQKIEFLEKNIPESRALSELYERMASLSMQERDYSSAYDFLEKAIAILERSEWPDPFRVSIMYHKMGAMTNSQKDFPKAIQSYEKCASLTRQIIAEGNMPRAPTIFYDLGKLYDMQGDKEKAIGCYEEQLAMIDSFPKPSVKMIIMSCQDLGNYFIGKRDFKKSAGYFLKGAQLLEGRGAEHEQTVAGFYSNAANSFSHVKQYEQALKYQLKAIAIQERIDPIPMRLAHGYTQIAYAYYNIGDYANALAYHQKALDIRKAGLPAGDMAVSFNNNDIALTYLALGDLPKALDIQQRNIAQAEQAASPDNPFLGTCYNHLGLILAHMGRWDEAEQALSRAEQLAPKSFLTPRNRAVLYALQGKKEDAIGQIRKGISQGYKDPYWLQSERAFDALRGEKDFQDLMK
jgi:tetratricopeptide (TPR) repeat protein